ncbi:hypothetical protein [Streptomyces chartreusis]|uniref:hypothetical protein n=1 Tax=Streptomyces chartreusis TaxID=1969 RepID=UPI00123E33E0|nr:hypothetical protein [Streptomyces chartreusis]QEV68180.1 hypothetical protein CP983_16840 [Streptomyces chartreusis]GGX33924.1 hypothetical protein GCM10010321_56370 [Streptomyces chartreusis]
MTWPASLSGAAVRVLRIAAGRRALQLVLVAGGLLAIGLLGGERAYAADGPGGVPVGTSSVSATSAVPATSAASSASSSSPSSSSASDELRSSLQDTVERLLSPPAKPTAPATKPTAPDAQSKPGAHDESTAPPADPAPEDHRPRPQAPRTQPQDQPAQTHTSRPVTHDTILTPVTEQVGRTVGTQVVEPVGGIVRTVTQDLAAGLAEVQAVLPPLASMPSLPTAPETTWPSWPGWELPTVPGIPDLPGADVPALPGQTLPAPVTGTPEPGSDAPGSHDGRAPKGRTGKEADGVHGPDLGVDSTALPAPAAGHAHRVAPSGHAPARQAPADHPGGAAGYHAVGDSGTPRHGDAHAVSLDRRVALRLVPGSAARAEADSIQDRHRDIPVSPA